MNAAVFTTVCAMNFPLTRGELVGMALVIAFSVFLLAAAFVLVCVAIKFLRM